MNGDTAGTAGVGTADAGRADDHPERYGVQLSLLDHIQAAKEALDYSNSQEAQEARFHLEEAIRQAGAAGEGQRGS